VDLAGGNDSLNMFVPIGASEHADYASARRFISVGRSEALPITPVSYSDGQAYGFHPDLDGLHNLFEAGDLSIMANTGPLIAPMTKDEYLERSVPRPSRLFAHDHQQDAWHSADASGGADIGWAGHMIDLMYPNGAPQPSPTLSIGGNSLWQRGRIVRPFEVGSNVVVNPQYLPFHEGPIKLSDAFRAMYQGATNQNSLLAKEHAATLERAGAFGLNVNDAIESAPDFSTEFPRSSLADQLQMVARLIAIRDRLDPNLNRQVFFCRKGGWDTHNNQVGRVNRHGKLLQDLDDSLTAFHGALSELGVLDSVTTFSSTEFGRTISPNSSGTDHGWGGHNIVMGGAVNGGDIFGQMPQITRDSPDAINNGRVIPTTSVDQYSATLAGWFGLDEGELATVFPNLGNFANSDVGFMA
jgi:uncharacterized protein (DUF1501 family)